MKFLYICVIAVILGVAQVQCDMKEEMHKLSHACVAESHATDEEFTNFFKNGMKDEDAKDTIKCHMKCMMEKQGHLKKGALDEEAVKKTLQSIPALKDHQEAINKGLAECKDKKGSNDCDTAYQITKCMSEYKKIM